MNQYIFILPHEPARYTSISQDSFGEIMTDYVAWVEKMAAEGKYAGGYKLADEAGKVVVAEKDGPAVYDGPFAEMAEVLGGVMVINAKDMDEAVDIARSHPHMIHNKRIEVRLVQAT